MDSWLKTMHDKPSDEVNQLAWKEALLVLNLYFGGCNLKVNMKGKEMKS